MQATIHAFEAWHPASLAVAARAAEDLGGCSIRSVRFRPAPGPTGYSYQPGHGVSEGNHGQPAQPVKESP